MVVTQEHDSAEVLKRVLSDALRRTFGEVADSESQGSLTRSVVRNSWIRCLRDAFSTYYAPLSGSRRLAVFGGTPRPGECRASGVPTGIRRWSRWEFLHDVAVVGWDFTDAPYARDKTDPSKPRQIPIVARALWQVESEIAADGTQVAEDASKLKISTAANKPLIASFTGQREEQPWLDFLARTISGADGNRFVALVPNYKSDRGYAQWRKQPAPF